MQRDPLPRRIQSDLYDSQNGRCAICKVSHPLEAHHITPLSKGGPTSFGNMVLLCRNCHSLADTGIVPTSLLLRYKRLGKEDKKILGGDPTAIYELWAAQVSEELKHRPNQDLSALARRLVGQLKKSHERRHRQVTLDLVVALLIAGTLQEGPARTFGLARAGKSVALNLGDDGNWHLKQILHYEGQENHKLGLFAGAIELFEASLDVNIPEISVDQDADKHGEEYLTQVHKSASLYLSGESSKSLAYLERSMDERGQGIETIGAVDADVHARIKLAEHQIQRKRFPQALEILEGILSDEVAMSASSPIYRAILYKDLGRVISTLGDRELGLVYFVSGYTVCEEYGYTDQQVKLLEEAAKHGIRIEQLLSRVQRPS